MSSKYVNNYNNDNYQNNNYNNNNYNNSNNNNFNNNYYDQNNFYNYNNNYNNNNYNNNNFNNNNQYGNIVGYYNNYPIYSSIPASTPSSNSYTSNQSQNNDTKRKGPIIVPFSIENMCLLRDPSYGQGYPGQAVGQPFYVNLPPLK